MSGEAPTSEGFQHLAENFRSRPKIIRGEERTKEDIEAQNLRRDFALFINSAEAGQSEEKKPDAFKGKRLSDFVWLNTQPRDKTDFTIDAEAISGSETTDFDLKDFLVRVVTQKLDSLGLELVPAQEPAEEPFKTLFFFNIRRKRS